MANDKLYTCLRKYSGSNYTPVLTNCIFYPCILASSHTSLPLMFPFFKCQMASSGAGTSSGDGWMDGGTYESDSEFQITIAEKAVAQSREKKTSHY